MSNEFMLSQIPSQSIYDAIVLSVSHEYFRHLPLEVFLSCLKPYGFILDLKNNLPLHQRVVSL